VIARRERAQRYPPLTHTAVARILVAALFVAAIAAFIALEGPSYLSLDALKANRDALIRFADTHRIAAIAITFGAYASFVALSLPGGFVFSLASGLLFGRFAGTIVAVLGETCGATLAFLAARFLFAGAVRRLLGARGARINAGFARHAFSYLLFLRVVPVFPFFIVNLAPAFTSVRVRTFMLATLLGAVPASFVYANLGQALQRFDSLADALSVQTISALVLLGLLALVPAFARPLRARFRRR
jgi:uncharacterized membrane protein YdjX (TVP38/TMEM64 family)